MKIRTLFLSSCFCLLGLAASPGFVRAQATEPFIGQIVWVPYTFCPRGWTEANGQLVSIASNTALFALIGTTYGGDGRVTFALPDLRGRVSLHTGQRPGGAQRSLGDVGGQEQVTLSIGQIPSHTHQIMVSGEIATQTDPNNRLLAKSGSYREPGGTVASLNPQTVTSSGGSQAHENMPPFLTMRACIALQGIFPSRN